MFTVDELLEKYYPQLLTHSWLSKPTCFFLRFLLKEREINSFGETYPHLKGLDFVEQVLEYFHFSYSTLDREKERIPTQGKLVIIANHPTGSLDGLALIKMVSEIRRDIQIIANEKLMTLEPLHELLLPANKISTKKPDKRSRKNFYLDELTSRSLTLVGDAVNISLYALGQHPCCPSTHQGKRP